MLFPFEQIVLAYSPRFNDTVASKGGTIVTHGGRQYVSTQTLLDAGPEDVDIIQVTFDLQGRVLRYWTYQEFDGDPALGMVTQLLWNVDGGNGYISVMLGGAAPVLQRLEMLIGSSGIQEEMDFDMLYYDMDSSGTQEEEDTRISSKGCEHQEYVAELTAEEAVRTKHCIDAVEAVKTRQRAELAAEIAVEAAKVRQRLIKGYTNATVETDEQSEEYHRVGVERPLAAAQCVQGPQEQGPTLDRGRRCSRCRMLKENEQFRISDSANCLKCCEKKRTDYQAHMADRETTAKESTFNQFERLQQTGLGAAYTELATPDVLGKQRLCSSCRCRRLANAFHSAKT